MDRTTFDADRRTRDVVERCLERVSGAATKLGEAADGLAPAPPWNAVKALGYVLRHANDPVVPAHTWEIATQDLPLMAAAVEAALVRLGIRQTTQGVPVSEGPIEALRLAEGLAFANPESLTLQRLRPMPQRDLDLGGPSMAATVSGWLEAGQSDGIVRPKGSAGGQADVDWQAADINGFEGTFAMERGRARVLWTSQCDVTPSIRERFGLQAALDYLVSEKLLNFAEAAASHPDIAPELPMFVAEVRRMFTPQEIRDHLAVLVPRVEAAGKADAEAGEDEFETLSPQEFAARLERLSVLQQFLEVDHLGTA